MSGPAGRVAIVTGASEGLGRALALSLSDRGWQLVIDARTRETLDEVVARIDSRGRTVFGIVGDVTDPDHRRALVAAAEKAGGLDLLVNNASMLGPSPQPNLSDYPLDVFRQVYETNVVAPVALIQHAAPLLRKGRGVVINVSSDAAIEPYAGWGGYGSSKAALDQISVILGEEEPDLVVYALDPGDMNTSMHQQAFPGEDISDRPDPETRVPAILALLDNRPPSGRYTATQLLPVL
jgi:NAD(P)-dependent dehydrogenase (short-subunit alcohol dehydrogenase family)